MNSTTITRIYGNDLRALELAVPQTLPEQTKIAGFLSAVDGKIQQLTRKKALLEQYKKGLMQQLFSQEIRFTRANGKAFPEWEERIVDECLKTVATRQYQIQSTEFQDEGKYPVVDQGKLLVAGYSDQSEKVMRNGGVIVYGDHTTEVKYIDFDFVIGADGTKVLTTNEAHDLKYLYYNLSFNNVEQEGYKRHFSILREQVLQIPCLEEQQRIAGFLSALDGRVAAVQQQLAGAVRWKKGLLQQMFV